jgi:hypothetical protein|tara:strand:- start:335 stop:577 length:243 start_codon:yes stop_codon:yes gene_type:complete
MKRSKVLATIMLVILINIILLIYVLFTLTTNLASKDGDAHIRNVIKTHNEVKNTNSKFPTMSKPSSSKNTVWKGDSVKID